MNVQRKLSEYDIMMSMASSSSVAIYTLIGALGGTAIGGSLTLGTEMFRRKWKKQDDTASEAAAKNEAIRTRRLDVYSRFLSTMSRLENEILQADRVGHQKPTTADAVRPDLDELVIRLTPTLIQFDYDVYQLLLFANPEVQQRAVDMRNYLMRIIINPLAGDSGESQGRSMDLTLKLLNAIRSELGEEPSIRPELASTDPVVGPVLATWIKQAKLTQSTKPKDQEARPNPEEPSRPDSEQE